MLLDKASNLNVSDEAKSLDTRQANLYEVVQKKKIVDSLTEFSYPVDKLTPNHLKKSLSHLSPVITMIP